MIKGKEPGESYTTGDYTVDEKHRSAALTEEGIAQSREAARLRQSLSAGELSTCCTTCSRR